MSKKPTHWDDDAHAKEASSPEPKEGELPPEPIVLPQTALVTSICQAWPIPDGPQPAFGEQIEVSLEIAKFWREMGYIA
jgi:hypothetical protein